VTDVRGTRVQAKIGTYIDTFLASMMLAEVKGRMPDEATEARVAAALDKVLEKTSRNQNVDGSWDNRGWAPVLAQSMASKGLNRAWQAGAAVREATMTASDSYFLALGDPLDADTALRGRASSAAGVQLYAAGASLGALQESANTNEMRKPALYAMSTGATGAKPEAQEEAARDLDRIAVTDAAHADVQAAVLARLDDPAFVAGFGTNGGEEFLSYMNISESLVVRADDDWRSWDAAMAENLSRVQNADGSWTGHHCITGRNFCTAAALLVLMADRTPVPVAVAEAAPVSADPR